MQPESNQLSITSGTRFIVPPQPQGNVISSTHGLCTTRCSERVGSAATAFFQWSRACGLRAAASSRREIASSRPHLPQTQIGSGVPQ